MKRTIGIILAVLTLLLLAACGEKVEYKIYSMGQKDAASQQGGAEKFYSFSELQFEGDLPHNLFNNPDSPKTKNVSICKDKLVLSY